MKIHRLGLIALVIGSCDLGPGPDAVLEFQTAGVADPDPAGEHASIAVASAQVTVLGAIGINPRCDAVGAALHEAETAISLHVTGVRQHSNCPNPWGLRAYSAIITNVEAGTYRFRVIHDHRGFGATTAISPDTLTDSLVSVGTR